jgi:uncharacterized protein (TIGR02453 family)
MAEAMNDLPPFPGIRADGLAFLEALKDERNQDRDWFNERKSIYTDELRWPLRCLVADVVRRLESRPGISLHGDPRSSVFRIYRDVRFSNDKRPYQTHVACKLTVDPALRDDDGLVYVHVEPPANIFLAAGIYAPPVKRLRPIRMELVRAPSRWKEVVERLESDGLPPESHGDDLKSMPRGFADFRDHELAEYLKWTSFLVVEKLSRADVQSPSLAGRIVSFSQSAWPLLQFIREAR